MHRGADGHEPGFAHIEGVAPGRPVGGHERHPSELGEEVDEVLSFEGVASAEEERKLDDIVGTRCAVDVHDTDAAADFEKAMVGHVDDGCAREGEVHRIGRRVRHGELVPVAVAKVQVHVHREDAEHFEHPHGKPRGKGEVGVGRQHQHQIDADEKSFLPFVELISAVDGNVAVARIR